MYKRLLIIVIVFLINIVFSDYSFSQYQQYYDVLPDIANCTTGTLKQSEKTKMLEYLNKIRDLHKLPRFEYDESFQDEAMEISLISVANATLSHTPDASYYCYSQTGYNGGISSNLYLGSSSYPSEQSVIAWMNDRNQIELGHRRWIVDPFVKKIAFGRVDGPSKVGGNLYCGMSYYYDSKTLQNLNSLQNDFVAVPYGDYPPSLWDFGWSVLSFTVIADKSSRWANNSDKVKYASTLNGNPVNEAYVEVEDESGNIQRFGKDAGLGWAYDGYGVPNYCYWQMHGLAQQKVYKVRIFDVLVNGQKKNFSYQFAFRDPFISKPGICVLSQPQNNATDVNPNITFQWGTSQGADYYLLQVSKSTDFSESNIVFQKTDISGTSWSVSGVLEPMKKYYWRVAGKNDAGTGDWSQIWNFTTTTAPDPPTLAGPANNATNVSMTPTLTWNAAPKADKYQLVISTSDIFATTVLDKDDITGTSYTLAKDILSNSTQYFWKVRSISNISGPSTWSPTWNFTTAAAAPGKPNLLSPPRGATGVSAKVELIWEAVEGATSYNLQVASSNLYNDWEMVVNESGLTSPSYKMPAGKLELLTQYYWRVASVGPGGTSDWSSNGRFTVGDASPVEEDNFMDNTVSIYPNPVNQNATLEVWVKNREYLSLKIYNALGETVASVFDGVVEPAVHLLSWDVSSLPSGIYYYQLIGTKTNQSGKFNIIK
ncbi:T9SS C-terminal target domain-containing protein [Bacteroidetes/Chlorobi group bacterium ChocPot_Mid]|nr:MAG: T9SS C-terminal target domain-containing protein [Bacteroidetes/Chlorobi group bacterium ChocPot_Mid]